MNNKPVQRFSHALDNLLGLMEQPSIENDPQIKAGMEIAQTIMRIPLEDEMTLPVDLRQAWIKQTRHKTTRRLILPSTPFPRAAFVIATIILVLIIGFYQPVFAAVGQFFGYVYIPDVGFLPRNTTHILAQPVRQVHNEQSLTVTRGITTPAETILFLKFTPIAQALDGAWLILPSGEKLTVKNWHYFPNQPNSTGVQVFFPPLPNDQDTVTLALKEGWRLPLHWIAAGQSSLPDVQVISPSEPFLPSPTETGNLCVTKSPVRLCLLAATAADEKTSLLLHVDYLDPALQPSKLGLTWQTESQPTQLLTSQGVRVSLIREEGNTLLFPTLPAQQKITLTIPAVLADINIPDQFITVDLGDNPQVNDIIPINAQIQILGATLHFSNAILTGDGVNSLRLTLNADDPIPSYSRITPIQLELGKPENIPDLYGSGILSGNKDIFVELIRPQGKIHGTIRIPIIKASVIVAGPFEISFVLPGGTRINSTANGLPTPTVVDVNPANYSPLATPTPFSMTNYHYTGENLQPGDLIYSLIGEDQSEIYVVQPGQTPRLLANIPGVVTQGFVHPDKRGMDYLAGVRKTKDGLEYVDELQLNSVRFDQPLPKSLYRFSPNSDNLIGTAIIANWSFDGHYGIYRTPNSAPGAYGWKYIWMDLNCRISSTCQPQELVQPASLDLYNAVFAPSDYRILFSGADRAGTGKDDIFLVDFNPNQSPLEFKNLTSSYNVNVSITPAQWTNASSIFTLCSPTQEVTDSSRFCLLDINNAPLTSIRSLSSSPKGIRLYGNYWISSKGKYLTALFFPTNTLEGETLPAFRLLNLATGEIKDFGKAQTILMSAFSLDEKYLAYVVQVEHGWKLVIVDLQTDESQTVISRETAIPAIWISWIK